MIQNDLHAAVSQRKPHGRGLPACRGRQRERGLPNFCFIPPPQQVCELRRDCSQLGAAMLDAVRLSAAGTAPGRSQGPLCLQGIQTLRKSRNKEGGEVVWPPEGKQNQGHLWGAGQRKHRHLQWRGHTPPLLGAGCRGSGAARLQEPPKNSGQQGQ